MLNRAGATREAIRYLENAYAFTEHPAMREVHEAIGKRLEALSSVSMRDAADAAKRVVDARWDRELPAVSRGQYLLLGPVADAAHCAGAPASDDPALRALLGRGHGRTWIARRLTMTKSAEPGSVAQTLSS